MLFILTSDTCHLAPDTWHLRGNDWHLRGSDCGLQRPGLANGTSTPFFPRSIIRVLER
jgi:hypothetical protein